MLRHENNTKANTHNNINYIMHCNYIFNNIEKYIEKR